MPPLSVQAIYDALHYDWWQDIQNLGNPVYQATSVYWQDLIGKWHIFTSTGPCPANPDGSIDASMREYYVRDTLMWDTARQLANTGCSGGITNVAPREWQPLPIYGR
jgi:hypothetical protein